MSLLNDIIELKDEEDFFDIIEDEIKIYEKQYNEFYKKLFLNNDLDKNECYMIFKSGSGGLEAMDFNNIILRMFLKYFEYNKYEVEIVNIQHAEQNLLREAVVHVKNKYAYGYLKNEAGVHRLTRVSPFGNGKLHTSFMEIQVLPIIEKPTFTIDKKDLRIDTYRGSGAGGQHRNKTDSAVRITHIPTNTVVCCESERSQIINRETAMKQLYSKLYILNEDKFKKENDNFKNDIESHWGNQIRSYLFNNNLVKDHITNKEYEINSFLNGNIDEAIKSKIIL